MKMEKNTNKIQQTILTSCVVASLITGIFSLAVSYETNKRLEDIEKQKYDYNLHDKRYDELKKSLEFFSNFHVYDTKFISMCDINTDRNSVEKAKNMMYDSVDKFKAELNRLLPYLSDSTAGLLQEKEVFQEDFSDECRWIEEVTDDYFDDDIEDELEVDRFNSGIKKVMKNINESVREKNDIVLKAITIDINEEYVSNRGTVKR
ncbi:hypothetical protein [Sellimonas intestinalis]|uniref:hypothetical protein n=1 Tax=Sellimonas intestinalis TaxID=1653434 RepID=UPI0015EBFCE3|nr:hypothetical protein [Sellimonas intestinalis]MBA2215227.1 hypothetical protein [Sellimonas intestinalis]